MVDRQDIDALLISSLYGELDSTEAARLTAHLDSHPADRAALANLTRAREVVRESRILQVQFDPPQSVSALLIQEAVRRAPKQRDENSWFQRFVRSFIAHPAMAAAATLVLVIGVASTVYVRNGDNFAKATKDNAPSLTVPAERSVNQPTAASRNAEDTAGRDPLGYEQGSDAASDEDDFKVKLDDTKPPAPEDRVVDASGSARGRLAKDGSLREDAALETSKKTSKSSRNSKDVAAAPTDVERRLAKAEPDAKQPPSKPAMPQKTAPRLDVTTPSPAPKEFGNEIASRDDGLGASKGDVSGTTSAPGTGAGAGGKPSPPSRSGAASPTAPPPPPPPSPAPSTIVVEGKEKEKQDKAASTELAWAKERHGKAVAAVKAGKCELAATIVVEIAGRASSYYAANVVDDRAIKPCAAYITAQREREAERTQRAKSTQRRAVDEAPSPATTTK